MLRLILLTIFLISSPVFGLIETLYETEHRCYSGCVSHYGSVGMKLNACKTGKFIHSIEKEIEDHKSFQAVSLNYIVKIVLINVNYILFMNKFKLVVLWVVL